MIGLDQHIKIRTAYTRSINLPRDYQPLELIQAYVPTSRAIQALEQIATGLGKQPSQRALALIGPYGSGKSVFALFLAALLSPASSPTYRAALVPSAGLLRGVRPIGLWSTEITLSRCSMPVTRLWSPGGVLDR